VRVVKLTAPLAKLTKLAHKRSVGLKHLHTPHQQ
jgi:hypothetical protein